MVRWKTIPQSPNPLYSSSCKPQSACQHTFSSSNLRSQAVQTLQMCWMILHSLIVFAPFSAPKSATSVLGCGDQDCIKYSRHECHRFYRGKRQLPALFSRFFLMMLNILSSSVDYCCIWTCSFQRIVHGDSSASFQSFISAANVLDFLNAVQHGHFLQLRSDLVCV